jgi:hypothetical protein
MGRIKQLMIEMQEWHENMPDLTGQALADAEREFLSTVNEADDMPLWIQLELDLWENMQGYGGECDL